MPATCTATPGSCLDLASRVRGEMTEAPFTLYRSARRPRRRPWKWVAVGVGAIVIALVATLFTRVLLYRHEAMPGVRVFGVELGGNDRATLQTRIGRIVGVRLRRPVVLQLGGQTLPVRPAHVVAVDTKATATVALRVGQESFTARAQSLLWPFG